MSQCPTMLAAKVKAVSPTPRSAPAPTACTPSETWNTATTKKSATTVAMTSASSDMTRASGPGARRKPSAARAMKTMTELKAVKPAWRAPGESPRPTAQPTRVAAALPMPAATQKLRLAQLSATLWAAASVAPRRPARSPVSEKRPDSAMKCRPMGAPRRKARPTAAPSKRRVTPGGGGPKPKASTPSCSQVHSTVERLAPATPSAGKGPIPNTSTTSSTTLATLATTMAQKVTSTCPVPCR